MEMDSMETVQGYKELSMDKCFNIPWTLSVLISMEIHGHSVLQAEPVKVDEQIPDYSMDTTATLQVAEIRDSWPK
jgi:hypothetical protein